MKVKISQIFVLILVLVGCSSEPDPSSRAPHVIMPEGETTLFYLEAGETTVENLSVRVLASNSEPVPGVTVFFTTFEGFVALETKPSVTDGNGVATQRVELGSIARDFSIAAEVPEVSGSPIIFNFSVRASLPAVIEIVSGDNQEALSNSKLKERIVVRVLDKFENPVSNQAVDFRVISGGGKLLWTKVFTDNKGLSYTEFTVGVADVINQIGVKAGNLPETVFDEYTLVPVTLATPIPSYVSTHLSWTQSYIPGFLSYSIYRAPEGTYQYTKIAEITDVADVSYDDGTSKLGLPYSYYVSVNTIAGNYVNSKTQSGERGDYIDLGSESNVTDFAYSRENALLYFAKRYDNRIVIISTSTFKKLDSIQLAVQPRRIALSNDNTKLYITVNGTGRFIAIDLMTKTVLADIDISSFLNSTSAFDIYQSDNNQIFVSGYGGYIVSVDEANSYQAKRVASNRSFFSGAATFVGEHGTFLYAEESFLTPNSLFKLDLTNPDFPIVMEDAHGSVSGTRDAAISLDGQRVFLTSGQVISTSDFTADGQLNASVYGLRISQTTNSLYSSSYGGSFENKGALGIINLSSLTYDHLILLGFTSSHIFLSQDEDYAFLITTPIYPYYGYKLYKLQLPE